MEINSMQDNLGRIGVLMGGPSSEREISLKSGEAVYGSLKQSGIEAIAIDVKTDDIREAPSLILIDNLLKEGAAISAFDPVAAENVKNWFNSPPSLEFKATPYDAIKDCHALVIMTEWDEFRALDLQAIKTLLAEPNILDARNIYEPSEMQALDFNYKGIGR